MALDADLLDERRCIVCGKRDDHPRCVRELPGGGAVFHHFDCGSAISPPCEHCTERVDAAGGVSGEKLRKFLRGEA